MILTTQAGVDVMALRCVQAEDGQISADPPRRGDGGVSHGFQREVFMVHGISNIRVVALGLGVCTGLAGCNVDGRWARIGGPAGPVVSQTHPSSTPEDESLDDAQEVDLVESVLTHRTAYEQGLRQLYDYYTEKGYASKAKWAAYELEGLGRVKQFRYLLDAEVAPKDLHPEEKIPEADKLYKEGVNLMRRGGHGLPAIYREDRMVEASRRFQELIDRYPTSDKIDDAAFYLGEIHKEYLKDQEPIAVQWYERAWTWNPQTPHPARFQEAVVYDYRLHDRDRALELYRGVLDRETKNASNVLWARNRIHELTRDHSSSSSKTAGRP